MQLRSLRFLAVLHAAALMAAAAGSGPAHAQAAPLMRYNNVVEWTVLLEKCGALTPPRRAHLRKLTDLAKQSLDWSAEKWAAHDAGLDRELQRLYPGSVPQVRCDELIRSIDTEMNPASSR